MKPDQLPRAILAASLSMILITGCASKPEDIRTAYVSTIQYERYDCSQLAAETAHVERRVIDLYQSLKKRAKGDSWQMGVGLVLFWPTLFALEGGDGPDAAEYSRLKGEYEALRRVSTAKKCGLTFQDSLDEAVKEDIEEIESEKKIVEATDDDQIEEIQEE